jgi:hypothetical protein
MGISKIILVRCGHGFSNNCPRICVNHFLNVKISQIVLFFPILCSNVEGFLQIVLVCVAKLTL